MNRLATLLWIAATLTAGTASARCAVVPTGEMFSAAQTVVLVSIVEARDGFVPWPYHLQKGALPGKWLQTRVVRSWKGKLRPGDTLYGWTLAPYIEHAMSTGVGEQFVVFFSPGSAHEILSCNSASEDKVATELDAITRGGASRVKPNTSFERTRGR